MIDPDRRFVDFIKAANAQEALRLKMLFDRAGIPYLVHDELVSTHVIPVPIRFKVPEDQLALAHKQLEAAFDVSAENIPERCPACDSKTDPSSLDCPDCGLFLG
ncbi:MAG: hypothetical protein AB8F95_04790 [Bacteroidia bacterium]